MRARCLLHARGACNVACARACDARPRVELRQRGHSVAARDLSDGRRARVNTRWSPRDELQVGAAGLSDGWWPSRGSCSRSTQESCDEHATQLCSVCRAACALCVGLWSWEQRFSLRVGRQMAAAAHHKRPVRVLARACAPRTLLQSRSRDQAKRSRGYHIHTLGEENFQPLVQTMHKRMYCA